MAIAVTSSKGMHRYDTVTKPIFTVTGAGTNPENRLVCSDQLYQIFSSGDSPITWSPLNRTEDVEAAVRRMVISTATLTSIVRDIGTTWTNRYSKTGGTGDGYHGAVFANVASGAVGIEMQPTETSGTSYSFGIYLQSGTASLIPASPDVEHVLLFGQGGQGIIIEGGIDKLYFVWEEGDFAYVECRDDFVRYWLIRDERPRLLRTTRSTMVYPVKPTFLLYHEGGEADVTVFLGDEDTVDVQVYGVLNSGYQDWQNPQTIEPLGERSVTKDKDEEFTYFADEENLVNLSIALEWRFKEEYQDFREFFQWHDLSKKFIFVDLAREKLLLLPTLGLGDNEMFAKFTAEFKDNPLGVETYGVTVDLRQAVNPPNVLLLA